MWYDAAMPLNKQQIKLLRLQARIDQILAEVQSLASHPSLSLRERQFLKRHLRFHQDAMRRVDRLMDGTV